ncbi:TonB-dependent receptor [Novosphingobium sp. AAP83]|uniref:TonB-dependent receptor n=1 Tax=Novosphingobium sp. AAP83 TaxID=1523425 RepID=UPI0006B891E8|nr:TonB-dependent receptor [Novosphingobium sp. AAP83]KPF90757.1 TonB-dependent receptor [Novosphingobium sp. AAP83]
MNSLKRTARLSSTLSALALVGGMMGATPALAQAADDAEIGSDGGAGIVVTARKRAEDILKVPVTVVAFSGESLEQRGVFSVVDMATATPGININNSSSGNVSRSFQTIIMRGFTPSNANASTTSMFIDGVPVQSPSQLTSIAGPERIEILKGPQAAYFGRATFAGAINVVNKVPTGEWGGQMTAMYGTQDSYRLQGAVEGPIFGEAVTFRVTGEKWKRGGTWTNAFDGSRLGTQSSSVATALLAFKPTETITWKVFGMLGEDKDGAPAATRVNFRTVTNPAGQVIQTNQSNCNLTGNTVGVPGFGVATTNPFYCGTLPNFADPISANTADTDALRAYLSGTGRRILSPDESVEGYGLLRQSRHAHTTLDFELSDSLTASVLAGYNREVFSTLLDLDGYDTSSIPFAANPKGYWDFPFLVERKNQDWSAEGRLAYDSGPLKALVGVSFLKASSIAGGGGSFSALPTNGSNFLPGDKGQNETFGIFGGLTYEVADGLTISAEGRYQSDKVSIITGDIGRTITAGVFVPVGTYAAGDLLAQRTYNNFAPRFIVNYDVNPDLMVYASYSKGVNAALNNANILGASAFVQQAAADADGRLLINPDTVTNYEVGAKGTLFNGALRYSSAIYFAKWKDQVNALTIAIPDPTATTGFSFVNVSNNTGNVDMYGIEADLAWKVNDLISIDAAGAINDSSIQSFRSTIVSRLTGVFDFRGNENKQTSKYSANVGVTFGGDLGGMDDASWFFRTDWNYKSGMWTNEANTTKTRGRNVFNARASITKGQVQLDVFVNNIFNDTNPATVADASLFTTTFAFTSVPNSVQLGLPERRVGGIQAKISFR